MTDPTTSDSDRALWAEVFRRKLDVLEARMDRFDEALSDSTQTIDRIERNTVEVVDLLHSFKGAIRTAEGLGKVMKPLAAIVAALATVGGSLWGFFQVVKGGGK